jgi:hypothetical protein
LNELLRDRILRRIENLPEDRQYQVLDYLEFLESKYATRQAPGPNVFQRFAEGIEDTLRAGNASAATVSQAMGFMSQAMNVLSGVAAAGKSVAGDLVGTAKGATRPADAPKPTEPPKPATGGDANPGTPKS